MKDKKIKKPSKKLEKKIDKICKKTESIYIQYKCDKELNQAFNTKRYMLSPKRPKKVVSPYDDTPDKLVIVERERQNMAPLVPYVTRCWRMTVKELNGMKNADVAMVLASRMYDLAMGVTTEGNVQALMYLLDKVIAHPDEYILSEQEKGNGGDMMDSPQEINAMASRILALTMERVITLKTADRLFSLLQKKIAFIETAVVMEDVEKLKHIVYQLPQARSRSLREDGELKEVEPL